MSDKHARQQAIREIVAAHAVASQEELRRRLATRGWDVTQSTLSRDLRELRLARIPDATGRARYAFPEGATSEIVLARLERMLPELLTGVEGVQVLVVARTMKSGAQPVAELLDQLEWPDVAGTIAGDDTVLIICRSPEGRERVLRKLRAYIAG
ncbi:MAG: arginine repressor [Gemmatimonas sp.]|uniref:arginine repressor n=1 Tax=Gemmatimonas sp. TaxID=1962908 RepID=UPI00391FBAA9|nr:arginine repressor [Gemmatimonadota bacterium]